MILLFYTIIQTLISLVAIFTSFVVLFGMLATAPWISSRCPATLVRFASSRSRTPAVMLFNACRGLSL
jgi:hypothetical protein